MEDYSFDPHWLTVDVVAQLREELPTWKAVFLSKNHEKFAQFQQTEFVKTLEDLGMPVQIHECPLFISERSHAFDNHQTLIELEASRVFNRAQDQREAVQSERRGCGASVSHIRAWHDAEMTIGAKPLLLFEDDETPTANAKAQVMALLHNLVVQGNQHRVDLLHLTYGQDRELKIENVMKLAKSWTSQPTGLSLRMLTLGVLITSFLLVCPPPVSRKTSKP